MIKNELYASENVGTALTVEQDDKRHATMKGLLESAVTELVTDEHTDEGTHDSEGEEGDE